MLELMARGGMRVGEVLNLSPGDIQERSLTIQNPKSGRTEETVYVPRKILVRLTGSVRTQAIGKNDRISPISSISARSMVKNQEKWLISSLQENSWTAGSGATISIAGRVTSINCPHRSARPFRGSTDRVRQRVRTRAMDHYTVDVPPTTRYSRPVFFSDRFPSFLVPVTDHVSFRPVADIGRDRHIL
jgi:integrase